MRLKSYAILLLTLLSFSIPAVLAGSGWTASQSESELRLNMSYVYFGGAKAYTDLVGNTKGSLTDISPGYFDIDKDGNLKLTGAVDIGFINEMHRQGIKVTPFLSNHWDRQSGRKALENREKLVSQIADAVEMFGLDGVNVDIENVTEHEKDSYTDFIRLLREKLPEGKSLSVAVAPNPYGLTKGWHGSYDYKQLAKYSDYLMIMAYDEHYQGGPTGPVAGYTFVENTIKAALNEVSPEKLVLGIPFYGRLWKQGADYGGYGISNTTVQELIAGYEGKVIFDAAARSPKAVITIAKNDVRPKVFGLTLDAGKYDIWYENEESIKSKLRLVEKYGLKGVGSWSLGQETKDTWDYYSLWLNGFYFADAQKSWARQSILAMMNKGWMIGVPGSRFMPDSPLTRAQAAVIFVRALGMDVAGAGEITAAENSGDSLFSEEDKGDFIDVEGHWAEKEIKAARLEGLFTGMGDGRFGPEEPFTREQMAVLLDRILEADDSNATAFPDVSPAVTPWSYQAIARVGAIGIFKGYPDGNFKPKGILTRAEMAALMGRASPWLG